MIDGLVKSPIHNDVYRASRTAYYPHFFNELHTIHHEDYEGHEGVKTAKINIFLHALHALHGNNPVVGRIEGHFDDILREYLDYRQNVEEEMEKMTLQY